MYTFCHFYVYNIQAKYIYQISFLIRMQKKKKKANEALKIKREREYTVTEQNNHAAFKESIQYCERRERCYLSIKYVGNHSV